MNDAEQQIIDLVHARSQALVNQDLDALERILHPGFIYTSSQGEKSDRATYLGRFSAPDGGPTWERQEISELEVRIFGDTAVANCRVHDVAHWGEDHLDAYFRATFIYLRTPEGWRCIAGHSSPIAEE